MTDALPQTAEDHFGARVAAFDRWADEQLERWRGNPAADFLFANASHLGDFSVIWHIIGLTRGLTSDERANQAIALGAVLGVESLLVNQGIKRLFRRVRPTESGDERYAIRRPSSSSFPSGHASSAFVAATVLTSWGGKRTAPIWFGLASVVGLSRVYVRIHHASDVIGGAALGLVLGRVAARIVKRLA
jgi:membrane-associated phospholipid phosphatase